MKPATADWPVISAAFTPGGDVRVAQGSAARPLFTTVSVSSPTEAGVLVSEVALPPADGALLAAAAGDTKAPKAARAPVAVLGPAQQVTLRSAPSLVLVIVCVCVVASVYACMCSEELRYC